MVSREEAIDPPSIFSLAKLFARVASTTLLRALIYPFHTIRAPTLRKDVLNTFVRTLLSHITIAQSRYLNASTSQRYLEFCASKSQSPATIEVQYASPGQRDGTKGSAAKAVGNWVGDSDAEIILLYLHGGAFFQPATSGTFLYLQHLLDTLNAQQARKQSQDEKKQKRIAAIVLSYTLAPSAVFPTQIREAAAVLRHLLATRAAEDIFLGGDSAGGNIVLGLVSHLLHPRGDVETIHLKQPLGGMVLLSPQMSLSVAQGIEEMDMLPREMVRRWGALYLGHIREMWDVMPEAYETHAYCEPYGAGVAWWEGLHGAVRSALVTSGGDEIFAEAIREVGRDMRRAWKRDGGAENDLVFLEMRREAHIAPIVEFMMGGKPRTQVVIEEWWGTRLTCEMDVSEELHYK